jgi:tetratricopeptide (TPR) repeat protein
MGVLQRDLGQTEEALESLKRCLELSPGTPLARSYLSLCDPDTGVFDSDESPNATGGRLWDDGFAARLVLEAECRGGGISRNPAVTPLDLYTDFGVPGTKKARSAARGLVRSAEGMLRRGLYGSAAEHCQRALSLDKDLGGHTQMLLASAYFGMNEWEKVEQALASFDGEGIEKGRAEELLGEVARRQGKFEEAVSHFDAALSELESDPWDKACVILFRAFALVALERHADARLAFEAFMRTAPIDLKYEISNLASRSLGREGAEPGETA